MDFMKRLSGMQEVEKIKFGRELFYGSRRRIQLVCLCAFVAFAGVIIGILLITSRKTDRDTESTSEQISDRLEENGENTFEQLTGGELNGGDVTDAPDESVTEPESETTENPIIYKDFSSDKMNVVNNTAFDIFFLESEEARLPKYHDKESKKPTVLILHTYASDRYSDSQSKYGVCAVGQTIADELNSMGIGAVYSSAVHDEDMNDPLQNARETIAFYLKMYPSIKYVFDVGISQEYEGERVVATDGEFMGQRAAQIKMLVAGNNMTTGRDNLFLAAQINRNLTRGEMDLAREIVYDDSIRNSTMTPFYLEIFIGSSGNREEEGMLSARVFAKAFGEYLI